MQDSVDNSSAGLPGLRRIPVVGDFVSYKEKGLVKTELIIFIRPVVMKQPSINGDLEQYREFLPASETNDEGFLQSLLP